MRQIRYYLWSRNEPMRLSREFMEGAKALPLLVSEASRFRACQAVWIWSGAGDLMLNPIWHFIDIDSEGYICAADLGMISILDQLRMAKNAKVPSLVHIINLRAANKKYRWQPSEDDERRIVGDIVPPGHGLSQPILFASRALSKRRAA